MLVISSSPSDMKLAHFIITSLACAWPFIAHAQRDSKCSGELPLPQTVQCIKQDFEKWKNDKEFIGHNKKFLQQGDKHYRKRRYSKAYEAYGYANVYLATPYAYLRASEAAFLSFLDGKPFEDKDGKSTGSCLQPARFVWVVDDVVQQYYKVGVELAKIHQYGPAVSPAYLAQSEKRISCLEGMATQYRGAKTGCVDISKLKTCMDITK